jgi:hypothetical protein
MYGGTPQDPKHVKVSEKFRNCVLEIPGRWLLDSTTPRLARTSAGAPGVQGPLEWGSWGFNAAQGAVPGSSVQNKMTHIASLD